VSRRLSGELRREQILRVAEKQFSASGFGATNTASLAKTAGISEAMVYIHFGTKRKLFEAAVERNMQGRLAALRERFFSIPNLPPIECVESMAESTVLACVDEPDNASIMVWALMELPEFATDLYRAEVGATEALWDAGIGTHLTESPLRRPLAVHLVPYAVRTCMAFGLWLATLRHKPATARAHARQYAEGVVHVARWVLDFCPEPVGATAAQLPAENQLAR
jgi:AcrR family transcriptional regulator